MKVIYLLFILNTFVLDFGLGLNEDCVSDNDCSIKEKSVCLNKVCTCDKLWYYSDLGKCVKYATEYSSICDEKKQCEFLKNNFDCKNNVCVCAHGYRWYQGQCRKFVKKGDTCSNGELCWDINGPLALSCSKDGKCECGQTENTTYYDRGPDCRVKSELNKDCAISKDCFPVKGSFDILIYSQCELGKCIKNTSASSLRDISSFTLDYDGHEVVNNLITNEKKCLNGVLSNLTETECADCPNAFLFKNATCICKQGFFLEEGKCIAELGMKDESTKYNDDADCPIKPGKLVDGSCYCKDYWFQDNRNRECKKTTLEYTKNCMDNDWCKAMGEYAFCNTTIGKCNCISEAVFDESSFYCNFNVDKKITVCLSDSDCALYENCINEQCQCTEGFYKNNGSALCVPKIGHSCEVRDCSHIENAVCSQNQICECDGDNFVTDGLLCLRPAIYVADECVIKEQCKNIKNTDCLPDSSSNTTIDRCLCTDEYRNIDGTCYTIKYPGSMCSTQKDCTIMLGDTFVCRNMLCQCPIGQTLNEDNVCVSSFACKPNINIYLLIGVVLIVKNLNI